MLAVSAVAITVGVAVTVFVAAIVVAVTAFLLDAVQNDVDLNVTAFDILDDAAEDVLVGNALTDNVKVDIAMAHKQESIGYETERRGVDDNIVVDFFQFVEQFVAFV